MPHSKKKKSKPVVNDAGSADSYSLLEVKIIALILVFFFFFIRIGQALSSAASTVGVCAAGATKGLHCTGHLGCMSG